MLYDLIAPSIARVTGGKFEMYRETLIKNLKEDIMQGRVVIIAGTGVSIEACENHPGRELARFVAKRARILPVSRLGRPKDAKLLGDQIKSKRTNFLISAAEEISHRLQSHSPGTYHGWLKDTVGKLVPKHRDILDALIATSSTRSLRHPRRAHCVARSAGYVELDGLIEQASNRKPVTWLHEAKVQEVLTREMTDAVLHIPKKEFLPMNPAPGEVKTEPFSRTEGNPFRTFVPKSV